MEVGGGITRERRRRRNVSMREEERGKREDKKGERGEGAFITGGRKEKGARMDH